MNESAENGSAMSESAPQGAPGASAAPVRGRPSASVFFAVAFLVIALAAALRFLFISRFEVWLDEGYCFMVARKHLSAILADLAFDNGPPLYYIMLHYWMRLFGESAAALRSLSAVFSVATVAAVVFWDTPWFSRTARLFAGFILAITPLAIYYAQETRMYSPVVFFVVLSMIFLERGLRTGSFRSWAFCALSTALALYTSYASFFVLPAGYVAVCVAHVVRADAVLLRRRLIGIVSAHVAAAILFAPWIPTLLKQPSAKAVQWIRPRWQNDEHRRFLPLLSLSTMTTGGAQYPMYLRNLSIDQERLTRIRQAIADGTETRWQLKVLTKIPLILPLVLMALLAAFMLFMALWRSGGAFPYRTLLVSWVLLSFLVPFAMSFLRPMFVLGRYDITGVPAFAILSGLGLSRMKLSFRVPALVLAALLFVYQYGYMELWPAAKRFSPKAQDLAAIASKGDVILAEAFEYGQLYYHFGWRRDDVKWLTFPRETASHAAWIDYDRWLLPGWHTEHAVPRMALSVEAQKTIAEASSAIPAGGRLIVVRATEPFWARAMDDALGPAVMAAVTSGAFEPDMNASRPDVGIVVLRKVK